ncbi:MAG: hypothetical protein ABL883_14735 [Terricaulis sp.]
MVKPSRLSQCVNTPAGVSFEEAAAGAEAALAELAVEAGSQMAAGVLALSGACADYANTHDRAGLMRIHCIAIELYTVAGTFEAPHLAASAKTLADFIEETAKPEQCPPAVLTMFAQAINALQRGGAGGQTPAQLARGLSLLASRALSGHVQLP